MRKMTPPYRTPSNSFYTKALFIEPTQQTAVELRTKDVEPVFSLHYDKPGLINARKTFVELEDPTGYKWAMTYLDSWDHFEMLCKAAWFRDALEEWRREIDARLASKALDKIKAVLNDPEAPQAQVVAAAKFLANKEYKEKNTKGRPTKEDVAGALKEATKQATIEDDDAVRIGLRVVK